MKSILKIIKASFLSEILLALLILLLVLLEKGFSIVQKIFKTTHTKKLIYKPEESVLSFALPLLLNKL